MRFRTLDAADVKGKRVLVRVDFNVPMQNGEVADVSRIERNMPTIVEIADRGGKVIVLSHYGRPKGRDPQESLRPVVAAVARIIGRPIGFADDCVGDVAESPYIGNLQGVGRRYADVVDLRTCLDQIAGLPRPNTV